jgi:benzoate-CoA ligase
MSNLSNDLGSSFNFAQHIIDLNASRSEKLAYIDDLSTLTYGELEQKIAQFGTSLLKGGVKREERILLLMHDCNDWPVTFLGSMFVGVVPVAINTLLTAQDYAFMLQHSRSQVIITSSSLIPVVIEALQIASEDGGHEVLEVIVSKPTMEARKLFIESLPDLEWISFDDFLEEAGTTVSAANTHPDDPGFWLYSSGSTGRPKGVLHTQANPYWTAELYGKPILDLKENDICFSAAKMFFAYGLGNALSFPLSVGATIVLMAERATPAACFKRFTELKPTVFFGAPTGYGGMLASPEIPPKDQVALRMCSSAGEALPQELGERWTKHFACQIIDGLGSTEMLHIFLSNRPDDVKYGTSGKPVPGYQVELRGEDGKSVPVGEIGDLFVKGPSSAVLYWNNRAKTRDTFQGEWTKSGDKYICDAQGYYTYSGRNDDMLKVSGIYVSPFEVEGTLLQHPAVLESAVIGVNDHEGLVKTKAFVVLKPNQQVSERELQEFVKDKLAPFKYPRIIEFVSELPKTATGKIQRFRLREQEQFPKV